MIKKEYIDKLFDDLIKSLNGKTMFETFIFKNKVEPFTYCKN